MSFLSKKFLVFSVYGEMLPFFFGVYQITLYVLPARRNHSAKIKHFGVFFRVVKGGVHGFVHFLAIFGGLLFDRRGRGTRGGAPSGAVFWTSREGLFLARRGRGTMGVAVTSLLLPSRRLHLPPSSG